MKIYTSEYDISTNDVMDWLYFLSPECNIDRHNNYTIPDQLTLHIGTTAQKKERSWYRRGEILNRYHILKQLNTEFESIRKSCETENRFIREALIEDLFDQIVSINAPEDNSTNKIINLKTARACGLKVPETWLSNTVPEIIALLENDTAYIVKDVALDPVYIEKENFRYSIGLVPEKLSGKAIKERLSRLHPDHNYGFLMMQKYVEKRLELRIFYLMGNFYSMGICSQSNVKTQTDYRNYDEETPNRCIPFKLPKPEVDKLDKLMKSLGLNCGSIDMIYTPKKEYVFLEVNPIGQFQWLSKNCNYDIERAIAQFLLGQ